MAEAWQYFQADAEKKIEALEAVNAQLVEAMKRLTEFVDTHMVTESAEDHKTVVELIKQGQAALAAARGETTQEKEG